MTDFEKWFEQHSVELFGPITQADAEKLYLAGQASAEQRVYELLALVEDWKKQHAELERERDEYLAAKLVEEPLRRQIALLERERDQWKYTAEIRQQHLEYTIKAQAGEPIYGMAQQRQLNPSPQVRSDVGSLGNTYPATERPYNPLNDYAVIPMNPTEPVKAQAGEHRPVARVNRQGFIVEMDDIQMAEGTLLYMHPTTEPVKAQAGEPTYTTGHCENHKHPKGCQLHNLHCGYPACDRKAATHPTTERRVPEDENLRMALENCRLLAARHRKEDWALLILGFCAEGGVVGSVMR